MAVSNDAPALDMAYKLVEYAGTARTKFSPEKVLLPGRKQVFRKVQDGFLVSDVLGCWDEELDGQGLLRPVMRQGQRLADVALSLQEIREYARRQLAILPPRLASIDHADPPFQAEVSEALQDKLQLLWKKGPR
jgi:nicotinate phosphoribosyltransferase